MNKTLNKYCIYFPASYLRGEKTHLRLKEIYKVFRFNEKERYNYKLVKLLKLIEFIKRNIPYYNKVQRYNIKNIRDLNEIEIMTKEKLKKHYNEMLCDKYRKFWRSTSGTTGEPFKFQKDVYASGYMDAVMYEVYKWHGIDIGTKQGRIWGTVINSKDRIYQKLIDYAMNRKRLSTFNLSMHNCIKYERLIRNFDIEYLYGYVNGIYELAEMLKRTNINWRTKLKCIIVTGEVLFEHQRSFIEDYFQTNVINEYGTTENGIIGFECKEKNMHIMPTIYIEIVEKDFNGYGKILVTELMSRSIPFIRYETGDVGKIIEKSCRCGCSFPILDLKKGRIDSYIKLPGGKKVYDAILAYVLKDYANSFKAYQRNIDLLSIEIVPKKNVNIDWKKKININLRKYLGNTIKIEFIVKNEIKKEESGKLRYFIPIEG